MKVVRPPTMTEIPGMTEDLIVALNITSQALTPTLTPASVTWQPLPLTSPACCLPQPKCVTG